MVGGLDLAIGCTASRRVFAIDRTAGLNVHWEFNSFSFDAAYRLEGSSSSDFL
jgi:hypothetical protein